MDINQVEKSIKQMLDSDISTNQLSRWADVTVSTISKLRNGKAKLDNISFINIKRLSDSYEKIKKEL